MKIQIVPMRQHDTVEKLRRLRLKKQLSFVRFNAYYMTISDTVATLIFI